MSTELLQKIEQSDINEIEKWLDEIEKIDKSYMPNFYYYKKIKKLLLNEKESRR